MTALRMNSMILALCFIIIGTYTQPLHAGDEFSGTLSGRVIDKRGQPVRFASAYLLPHNIRVDVDADGFYAIENIEPGTYYLTVVQPGYRMYLSCPIQFVNASNQRRVLVMRSAADETDNEYNEDLAREFERVLNECKLHTSTATPRNADIPKIGEAASHVEEHGSDLVSTVSVSPVPATDKATCTFTLRDNANVMIEIFSITSGSRVALLDAGTFTKGVQSYSLNTSGLPSGTYTLLVRASNCEYALTSFIKE